MWIFNIHIKDKVRGTVASNLCVSSWVWAAGRETPPMWEGKWSSKGLRPQHVLVWKKHFHLSWWPKEFFLLLLRNGPEFEARIRQNEINNPKFNFLNPNDPYHAYYRHKVSEFKEGKAQEPSAAIPKVMQQQQSAQQQLPQKVSAPFHHFGEEFVHFGMVSQPGVEKEGGSKVKKEQLVIHLSKCQQCLGLCVGADVHLPGAGNWGLFEIANIQFNWSILIKFSFILTDKIFTLGITWTGCGRGQPWESFGVLFGHALFCRNFSSQKNQPPL